MTLRETYNLHEISKVLQMNMSKTNAFRNVICDDVNVLCWSLINYSANSHSQCSWLLRVWLHGKAG